MDTTVTIEVTDSVKTGINGDDNRMTVKRLFGSCSLPVSGLSNEIKGFSGWRALDDSGCGGDGAILLSCVYHATTEEMTGACGGWLRLRSDNRSRYYVLDPFAQVLRGFPSEDAAAREDEPEQQHEVRASRITGLTQRNDDKNGEIMFDLEYESSSRISFCAPTQAEWEKWFDALYRTARAYSLEPNTAFSTYLRQKDSSRSDQGDIIRSIDSKKAVQAARAGAPSDESVQGEGLQESPNASNIENRDLEQLPIPISKPDHLIEIHLLKVSIKKMRTLK